MPTAFVRSGGASLGAFQVGVREALHEREIHPDLPRTAPTIVCTNPWSVL